MIDVSDIVNDPDLASYFVILRDGGSYYGPGGISAPNTVNITAYGVVTPAEPELIMTLPEGDRISATLSVITSTSLYQSSEGPPATEADYLIYNGDKYRVVRLLPWPVEGYCHALAAYLGPVGLVALTA